MIRSNNESTFSAEIGEGRTSPKGNGGETAAVRTLGRKTASNGLIAVRQAARQSKSVRFTALHHITIDLLKQSYFSLGRDSAPGIDGVTWQAYGENLEEKLKELHDKVHRGSYRAHPARRTYIPKADGSKRPRSILCLEDKIVQPGGRDGSRGHLRGGFPRVLLRIPAGTQPARCAGRSPCWHTQEAGELGA
jgi:RNA-directed DNA polymerase